MKEYKKPQLDLIKIEEIIITSGECWDVCSGNTSCTGGNNTNCLAVAS